MKDIARIATAPSEEDRLWFPDIAGNNQPLETLRHAWAEYRDESFIRQFLSPKVIRDFRMFRLEDDAAQSYFLVDAIHDDAGYRDIRRVLADSYDPSNWSVGLEIVHADMQGSRTLHMEHRTSSGRLLHDKDAALTLSALADLWGYQVSLREVDMESGATLGLREASPE